MMVEKVLSALRTNRHFMENVVAWERMPSKAAQFDTMPLLNDSVIAALQRKGITQLFTHQTAAINHALAGKNVIISTRTASGKTLCYNLPMLNAITADPRGRALYIYPTKALAQDQLAGLNGLLAAHDGAIEAHVYDGDTPRSQRGRIRKAAQIMLTNPDMLHMGILPYHTSWRDLFANLRYIVIDETHTYRGVFGSHVANVLRRLHRLCRFYGSDPQFICATATIANPQAHAQRLCEQPFALVDETANGAPRGEKHFILYNPPFIDEELGLRQSMLLTTMETAGQFLRQRIQTVTFARSRQGVELLLGYLRDYVESEKVESKKVKEVKKERVEGYRGGYLPLERRRIEEGLRMGEIEGVVATNALELGVDIGALDAAVLAGYPGSIASVWQQAGRAGRRDGVSAAVLIAGNTPLEQYICRHPAFLFGRSPEHALINPDNLAITLNHLQCAAYELPFESTETWGDFGTAEQLLAFLQSEGLLHETRNRYHWVGEHPPAHSVSLRTGSTDNVVIQTMPSQPDGRPNTIGEIDISSAPTMVHEGAIYLHGGQSYQVAELDWDGRIAHVQPVSVDYYTRASSSSDIRELTAEKEIVENGILHAYGDVLVVSKATNYRKVRRYTHETLGRGSIDLPPREHDSVGYWLILSEEVADKLFERGVLGRPNDYGRTWQTQRKQALQRDGYACTTCTAIDNLHVHHKIPFRRFHDPVRANQLDNLVTLCASCHRRAEQAVEVRSAMSGLAYVLRNLAPLFLMCDERDIQLSAQTRNPLTQAPTIVIYEQIAGIGFSQKLFELRHQLLASALELVRGCRCRSGCPACVGPTAETESDTKTRTMQLLQILSS